MNLCSNPYNLAFVNLGPQLYDYTSTPKQEVSVLSLGGGYYFIYLFIYSYDYFFYITTSYIRLQQTLCTFNLRKKFIQWTEPPFNKPLYNNGVTNYFLQPAKISVKCLEQNLALTNLDLMKSTVSGGETLESQGLDKEVPHDLVIMD